MRQCLSCGSLLWRSVSSQRFQASRSINVWEPNRKAGFEHKMEQFTVKDKLKYGYKILPSEFGKLGREIKDKFTPQFWYMEHGDYKYQWKLNSQQALDEWVVSTDGDMDCGYSKAALTLSSQKCMLFHGFLNTKPPDDGKTKYAGYVNLRSPYQFRSFGRLIPYDWADFTHLVIRCRGDGRPYQLNVQMENYYDVTWHDIYSFWLYTRGGPYWQISKIPFSKFFLGHKGRVQDKQEPIHPQRIRNFGITLADDAQGPFQLEVDYIGLIYDAYHKDEFFYEMYDGDPLMS